LLTDARGINDRGQVVAFGRDMNGLTHSFLLTPIPEPGSITLVGLGALGLIGYGWRRRGARS
jgi:hypothetical protein